MNNKNHNTQIKSETTKNITVQITTRYLRTLFSSILILAIAILSFIWIMDPYGVSPLQLNLSGINNYKPKRLNIDRLIKPYEVWHYQPKTVFLGTSRIHESIDPSVFDKTKFSPAYNAAIPASTLAENAAHIEQYLKLDHNIKHLFIELFLYNFTTPQQKIEQKKFTQLVKDYSSLQLSMSAFLDAAQTLFANKRHWPITAHIEKTGYWVPSSDFNPADTFSDIAYIRTVLAWDNAAKMRLQPSALKSLDHIVQIAHQHNVKLHLLLTPNYPWDDYRLMSLGYWSMLEEWIRKMAAYPNVVSFSQYNNYLEEPPTANPKMKWWNDPTHFSLNMGHAMMLAYLGKSTPDAPKNLMRQVNPATVESIIAERRAGALNWARTHSDFVENFEELKTSIGPLTGSLNIPEMTLTINGQKHPIVLGVGEVSFIAAKQNNTITPNGWAVDEIGKRHVSKLVATAGSAVVAQGFATVKRADIDLAIGQKAVPSGFSMEIPLKMESNSDLIRVFALMKDGRAVLLSSQTPLINGMPLATSFGKVQSGKITIGDKTYPIVKRIAGSIEKVQSIAQGYSVAGWAADVNANKPAASIIVAIGPDIIAKGLPIITREDITKGVSSGATPSGFVINIPFHILKNPNHAQVRLFALMADNVAVPLAFNHGEATGELF